MVPSLSLIGRAIGLAVLAWLLLVVLRWGDPRLAGLLANTAWLAFGASAIAVPVGTFCAVAIVKTNVPGRYVAALLLASVVFVPIFVQAAAWDSGFGMQGWYTLETNPRLTTVPLLAGWPAAIWVHGLAAVPWVALIVGVSLRNVEPELEEDAVLHAPPATVLWKVSTRRCVMAMVVAGVWVLIVCTAEISVTDLFQVRTFAEEVYTQSTLGTLDMLGDNDSVDQAGLGAVGLIVGLALTVVLVVASLLVAMWLWPEVSEPPTRPGWVARLGKIRWLVGLVLWVLLTVLVGVPLASLVHKAGVSVSSTERGRQRSWSARKAMTLVAMAPWEHRRELLQTTKIAAAAATAAVLVGFGLAWSLRRNRRVAWSRLGLLGFCLTIPGPLLGLLVIRLMNQPPDSWLAPLAWLYDDTLFAPWLVQTIRALPVATLVLWPALASIPQSLLDSAATAGAGSLSRLLLIVLPSRWFALLAAWMLAFAVAAGELAATILVIPPGPTTISIRIFSLSHYGVEDRLASICLVIMGVVAVTTVVAAALLGWIRRK